MSRRRPTGNGFIVVGIAITFVNPVLGAIVMTPGFVIKLSRWAAQKDDGRQP